ncbi:MAG: hypothetical protein QG597_2202 [Actinomycetota bacterium]|nr:hypothetical protein [Actinomycetota bacterium]
MNGRDGDAATEDEEQRVGALRVAPSTEPTDTRWIRIGADLAHARRAVHRACHTPPEQALIITAPGYGRYGRERHRLALDVLCAMHQVAEKHHVLPATVGNWLHAEGATTTEVSPQDIADRFTAAYIGPFSDEMAYTHQRMAELGWNSALAPAGIPDSYLDVHAIKRDWCTDRVRRVESGTCGRIEVFHRGQPH